MTHARGPTARARALRWPMAWLLSLHHRQRRGTARALVDMADEMMSAIFACLFNDHILWLLDYHCKSKIPLYFV
jgi:hypothetical protein